MLPYFSDTQIATALRYHEVIETLDAAYADLATGNAAILPRQRCAAGTAKFSSMGGLWATRHVAATKSYPTVNGQFSFLINLFDTALNQPLAVMAASEITRFRTAAQTALVASRLCANRVAKVALFGAGVQGLAQVAALQTRVTFDELAIVDPALRQAPQLNLPPHVRVALTDARSAVEGADMVITATRSLTPVFDGTWLKSDALVAAIGISSANGRELDNATFERAEQVVVEWLPQSRVEAGDVLAWLNDNPSPSARAKIVDLPSLYRTSWPRRSGLTVYKSVGTGLADCACGWLAWQRLTHMAH
jgi:ornithine cyclodeaminase